MTDLRLSRIVSRKALLIARLHVQYQPGRAFATEEIDNIKWEVLTARKGPVPEERVLNALGRTELRANLGSRRNGRKLPGHRGKR
jgi:hypothetical protein